MTDSNVLELAKLGDPQAIAALMNQSLASKGMLAKVERQGDCLEVVLEAERVPNRQALTAFVQKGVSNLGIQAIRSVRILGQQVGASYPAWMQELQLDAEAPFNIQPETDSDITIIQSLEDTLIQGRESSPDTLPAAPLEATSQPALDDLWANDAASVEQSPDFLQELLAADAVSVSSRPAASLEPNLILDRELDPDSDASILSFLDELSGEPAESDFPSEFVQPQSAYLEDLSEDLTSPLDNFTADDFEDLMAAPDPLEPLPTELWLDSPVDLSVEDPEADLLNFLDQPPAQSEAETAETALDLGDPNDFADLADLSVDFPDATFISQIPSPEPDLMPEISSQQLEDLFSAEPVTESFSEEPWLEHLPEELPYDLAHDAPDSQADLQQSLVNRSSVSQSSVSQSPPSDPWNQEAEPSPDFITGSDDLADFTSLTELSVEQPVNLAPDLAQTMRSEPELADALGNYEPALDLANSLPDDLSADLQGSDPELDPTESSGSLGAWAESDDTALELASDTALAQLDDDDDIEELPPDFLQDWENESPEFSEFVPPAAPIADSFVAAQSVSLAPVLDNPDFNQPALVPDAAPSTLETELDLLDLDTPELESPGLDALEPAYPDLPQLNLADTDEFELDQPLPDTDLAELLSETPEGASVSSDQPAVATSLTASLSQDNLSQDNLSQDSLEQGLGDFREGFVEPLPDDFFENEAESADWQAELRQANLHQPLDSDIDDANYIIDETPPHLPPHLPSNLPSNIAPEPSITAGPPLRSSRPAASASPVAPRPSESREPALIWVLLPLCMFIGGLLGFVLFKNKISTPPSPPPASESTPVPVPTPVSPAPTSPSSANPSDLNALQVALERADTAVGLGQTAQSVDDWKLVANRWQQSIELLKAISTSSPSYGSAQQKLAEYQTYLTVAQGKANQPILTAAPLGIANINASPSPSASPAISLTCNPIASTPNSQPVELSSVQFASAAAQPSLIIGCITNHTNQPITSVDLSYSGSTLTETTGKLTFTQLAPQQTVPFKSEFTVVPEARLAIAALSWTATGSTEAKRLPVTISVTRPAAQG